MEGNLLTLIENEKNSNSSMLLQINRIKLIDYIRCGLIVPDRYIGDECEKDIQSKNKDFLVLSDGYLLELNDTQILIELILTDQEKEKLHKINGLVYFDFPLPITRIKKVYVQDNDIAKHIQVRIQTSDTGYLPKELFDVYKKSKKLVFERREYTALEGILSTDYSKEIRVYDKRMGMISFMKNTNLYYADTQNYISNYSDHYFARLSTLFKEKFDNNHFEQLDVLKSNEEFYNLLFSDKQIDKEFIIQTAQSIEDEEIKELFLQFLQPTGGLKLLPLLIEKDRIDLYLIGLVYYFRQKDSNKKDNFKSDIKAYIPSFEFAEISLAVLGIYLGYANLRPNEKIDIKDTVLKKLFGDSAAIKFTLESKLDYISIETIYNYCFNNKEKGEEYDYLPYPKKKQKPFSKITNTRWYEVVENKYYFDQQYIKIKRHTFEEIVNKKLENYPEELTSSKNGILLGLVLKRFPSIISPGLFDQKLQISCKKNDFIEQIVSDKMRSKQDKILDLIEIDSRL